jgi:hypothetical protein
MGTGAGQEWKGGSGLGTPVGLYPGRGRAEEGILIAHLVGTPHPRRGPHSKDGVVDELQDIAPAFRFPGKAGTRVFTFRLVSSFSLFCRVLFHDSTPIMGN